MFGKWLSNASTAAVARPLVLAAGSPQALAQLSGQVTSAEGAMEGVVVSARKDGSNITISLNTNAQGRFTFPADRLETGKYAVTIRATGYELDGTKTVDV